MGLADALGGDLGEGAALIGILGELLLESGRGTGKEREGTLDEGCVVGSAEGIGAET